MPTTANTTDGNHPKAVFSHCPDDWGDFTGSTPIAPVANTSFDFQFPTTAPTTTTTTQAAPFDFSSLSGSATTSLSFFC
jgi:hypothetical protein